MKQVAGIAAVLLSGFATAIPAAASADDFDTALDEISEQSLKAHYAILAGDAMEGRFAGTAAYQRAADYVAAQFALIGLEAAGEEGWFQQVPLVSYRIDTETATVYTHRDGIDTELTYREDYGMGGDKVRESTEVRAEVVYVGFGVHAPELGYSDYDGVDVEGKIVVVRRFVPAGARFEDEAHQRRYGDLVVEAKLPKPGQGTRDGYEGDGFVIVRHPESAVVEEALNGIVELIQVELV